VDIRLDKTINISCQRNKIIVEINAFRRYCNASYTCIYEYENKRKQRVEKIEKEIQDRHKGR
jgi:hypothetical protein